MGEFWFASAAVSAGASLHPAGQTESVLVSRVPPKAKDRRGLWAPHPWGASRRSTRRAGSWTSRIAAILENASEVERRQSERQRRDRRVHGEIEAAARRGPA